MICSIGLLLEYCAHQWIAHYQQKRWAMDNRLIVLLIPRY